MDELIAKLDRLIHTTNELHSHYDEINTLISENESYSTSKYGPMLILTTSMLITDKLLVYLRVYHESNINMRDITIAYSDTILIYQSNTYEHAKTNVVRHDVKFEFSSNPALAFVLIH